MKWGNNSILNCFYCIFLQGCACSSIFFEEETVHEIVMQKITLTSQIPTFRDKKTGGCTSSHAFGSQGGVFGFFSQSL